MQEDEYGYSIHNSTFAAEFPNNCVGLISIKNSQGEKNIGSGFLVSSDLVLTTASNVSKIAVKSLVFYPGVPGQFGKGYKIKCLRIQQRCKQGSSYNYALLKLESKVERKQMNFIELLLDYKPKDGTIGMIGYEENGVQASIWKRSEQNIHDNTLYHRLSATPCFNGGPLMVMGESRLFAIGISMGALEGEKNCARLITSQILCDLVRWQKQMTSQIKFYVSEKDQQCLETDKWLGHIGKEVIVQLKEIPPISRPNLQIQIPEQPQKKHIQINQHQLDEMVRKLEAISQNLSEEATSLTLKVTIQQF